MYNYFIPLKLKLEFILTTVTYLIASFSHVFMSLMRKSHVNIRITHDFIWNHLKSLMRKWEILTFRNLIRILTFAWYNERTWKIVSICTVSKTAPEIIFLMEVSATRFCPWILLTLNFKKWKGILSDSSSSFGKVFLDKLWDKFWGAGFL